MTIRPLHPHPQIDTFLAKLDKMLTPVEIARADAAAKSDLQTAYDDGSFIWDGDILVPATR